MYFIDDEHKKMYQKKLGQVKKEDTYIKSLIYLLCSNKETRLHFESIYDIKRNEINMQSLKEPWQTNTSINTCRLAFNLFGGVASDEIEEGASYLYSVNNIFSNMNINLCFQAVKLRFM